MSFLRRLFGRPSAPAAANAPTPPGPGPSRRINLVADDQPEPVTPPANIGIQGPPDPLPWTVARLERIVRRANANPADGQFQLEARHARHCLSRFWLQAPIDQLEALYGGPIGQVQRLEGPLAFARLAVNVHVFKLKHHVECARFGIGDGLRLFNRCAR